MQSAGKWVAGIVIGVLLTLAPLFGLFGIFLGMARAFHALGRAGIADPKGLSIDIHGALISTALGVLLCPIGIIVLTVSLIFFFRARSRKGGDLSSLHGTPHV